MYPWGLDKMDRILALLKPEEVVDALWFARPLDRRLLNCFRVWLQREEADEWRAAVVQAEAEGTFFVAQPFHCAVGTRP